MNSHLLKIEQEVLATILPHIPGAETLRKQIRVAQITREFSGIGFFVEFELPPETTRTDATERQVYDATGVIDALPCLFLLFIADGAVEMLEGVTCPHDVWPVDGSQTNLQFHSAHAPPK